MEFDNSQGQSQPARSAGVGEDDTGYFFFFDRDKFELIIKVIDACELNNRFWAFYGSTSNVEYEITVTDTKAGTTQSYPNPLGTIPLQPITDTDAFSSSPTLQPSVPI